DNSRQAGHPARAVLTLKPRPTEAPPTDRPPTNAVAYILAGAGADPRAGRAGGGRWGQAPWPRPSTLLAARLPAMPPDRPARLFAHVLPLDQCLPTRLTELVVPLDDLAVSQETPMPSVPAGARTRSPTAWPALPWPLGFRPVTRLGPR
ncbi:hypothetical protein ABZ379_03160, partial [Streptomyces canus]